jgi:hypothetical protein
MTKAETQIFKSGIFRFFELLKKNKRIEYALYKMGIRTGGGKISLFFGIHQRTKKINAIRSMSSFFSSYGPFHRSFNAQYFLFF